MTMIYLPFAYFLITSVTYYLWGITPLLSWIILLVPLIYAINHTLNKNSNLKIRNPNETQIENNKILKFNHLNFGIL